jgi:hypothetical protein
MTIHIFTNSSAYLMRYRLCIMTEYTCQATSNLKSCSLPFILKTYNPQLVCISTACCGIAERTVYDLGGWILWQFLGPLTPPAIEVLNGRMLGPSDVLGRTYYPLLRFPFRCQEDVISCGDATSPYTLDGAAVELCGYCTEHKQNSYFTKAESSELITRINKHVDLLIW